jgi:hypothetical protein
MTGYEVDDWGQITGRNSLKLMNLHFNETRWLIPKDETVAA